MPLSFSGSWIASEMMSQTEISMPRQAATSTSARCGIVPGRQCGGFAPLSEKARNAERAVCLAFLAFLCQAGERGSGIAKRAAADSKQRCLLKTNKHGKQVLLYTHCLGLFLIMNIHWLGSTHYRLSGICLLWCDGALLLAIGHDLSCRAVCVYGFKCCIDNAFQ